MVSNQFKIVNDYFKIITIRFKTIRWRVGDGKSIRVWKDSWLGGSGLGRVVSPRINMAAEVTLDFFIDAASKQWKENLVREHFLPFEADQILSIPIRLGDKKDELCWFMEETESFV